VSLSADGPGLEESGATLSGGCGFIGSGRSRRRPPNESTGQLAAVAGSCQKNGTPPALHRAASQPQETGRLCGAHDGVEARAGAVSCREFSKIGSKSGYGFYPQTLENFALLATRPGRPERALFRRGGAQERPPVGRLSGLTPAEVGRDRADPGPLLAHYGARLQSRRGPDSETPKARLNAGFSNPAEFRWRGLGPRADRLGTDTHRRRLDCLGLSGRVAETSKPQLHLNPVSRGHLVLVSCSEGAHRRLCKRLLSGPNPLFPLVGAGVCAPRSWYEAEGSGGDFGALLTASLALALRESGGVPWFGGTGGCNRRSSRFGDLHAPA
jgi:hypothetical protein